MTGKSEGITLLELLITISITVVLTGVVLLMLKTGFEVYSFSYQEQVLEQVLDDVLEKVSGESIEEIGIKDALEINSIGRNTISIVPLWVDDTHALSPEHYQAGTFHQIPFVLNRPVRPGSGLPLMEARFQQDDPNRKRRAWKSVPIEFVTGSQKDPLHPDDRVYLTEPLVHGQAIRFVYHPQTAGFPDARVVFRWDKGALKRIYRGRQETIPRRSVPGVVVEDVRFIYLDSTGREVEPNNAYILRISAIKVVVKVAFADPRLGQRGDTRFARSSKEGYVFINLRNSPGGGAGILLSSGMRVKIPNSHDVRVFSVGKVVGSAEGGILRLEARPEQGSAWAVGMQFEMNKDVTILKRYTIEYPPGNVVYQNMVNLSTEVGLDFMRLDSTGRYDYDFDEKAVNTVDLQGKVELVVTQMDVRGAALFVRP